MITDEQIVNAFRRAVKSVTSICDHTYPYRDKHWDRDWCELVMDEIVDYLSSNGTAQALVKELGLD